MNLLKTIFAKIWAVYALLLFVITFLIVMIPVSFIYFIAEPKRSHIFIETARIWMGIYMPLIGCPVKVTGKDNFAKGKNYIVVCNHNSLLDIPISCPNIPGGNKTIAKIEMAKIPIFGIYYKLGSVIVDRKSEKSRRDSFAKMKQVLNIGLHMSIYPEGTRNTTKEPLKQFHDGAFKLAIDTKKPILPAVIFNTKKAMPTEKGFYLMPHKLQMDFLPAIEINDTHTVETLKQQVFELMKQHYVSNS